MKIISITTSFPHPLNQVSGIFVYNLLVAIAGYHEVIVVTPSYGGICGVVNNPNMEVIACRYAPQKLEMLAHSPGGIPAAMKRNLVLGILLLCSMLVSLLFNTLRHGMSADIVHANWSIGGFIALPLKLFRKKIIVTLRGDDVTRAQSKKINRMLLGFLVRFSDQVVAVSQEMHQWLIKNYKNSEKIIYIGNGVDQLFSEVGRERHYASQCQTFRFISVGSLIPRKNIGFILNALNQLRPYDDWTLSIIGDGVERPVLERQCKDLDLSGRVSFIGALEPEAVALFLKESHIFLFSSLAEGKPNVLLEAMAAGLVIIAPRISGVNELIEHEVDGLLYSPGDLNGFIDKIKSLKDNPNLLFFLGSNAFSRFNREYGSWDNAANNYIRIFEHLRAL